MSNRDLMNLLTKVTSIAGIHVQDSHWKSTSSLNIFLSWLLWQKKKKLLERDNVLRATPPHCVVTSHTLFLKIRHPHLWSKSRSYRSEPSRPLSGTNILYRSCYCINFIKFCRFYSWKSNLIRRNYVNVGLMMTSL